MNTNLRKKVEMRRKLSRRLGLILPLILCSLPPSFGPAGVQTALPPEDPLLIRVGTSPVTLRDAVMLRWMERERLGNTELTVDQALRQLVENALEREVAGQLRITVSDDEVEQLNAALENAKQSQAEIRRIKSTLGEHVSYFDKLYARPLLLRRKLQERLRRDEDLHVAVQAAINGAWQQIETGAAFEAAAEKFQLQYRRIPVKSADQDNPLLKLAASLKPGEVYPTVLVTERDYSILRLAAKNDAGFEFEAIVANKLEYPAWLRQQCAAIRIFFLDPQLEGLLRESFPQSWWLALFAR